LEHNRGWPAEGWQTLNTAPRDGSKVRMREVEYPFREKIGYFSGTQGAQWVSDEPGVALPFRPTEWLPW
jgi:hypothetical protein